jgi:hypothetical protein
MAEEGHGAAECWRGGGGAWGPWCPGAAAHGVEERRGTGQWWKVKRGAAALGRSTGNGGGGASDRLTADRGVHGGCAVGLGDRRRLRGEAAIWGLRSGGWACHLRCI